MDFCPYDNVEFPLRSGEDGPPPQTDVQSLPQQKYYHQTLVRDKKTSALSPVKEAEDFPLIDDDVDDGSHVEVTAPMGRIQENTTSSVAVSTKSESDAKVLSTGNATTTKRDTLSSNTNTLPNSSHNKTLDNKATIVFEQPRSVSSDICWPDFNPSSTELLQTAYTRHHSNFYRLNEKILQQSRTMRSDVGSAAGKYGETLTYEQLLQGMLEDGERLVLGGAWLYFVHLYFLDAESGADLKPSLRKGRLCLTNKKLLILSAENVSDANLEDYGDPKTPSGGYKLSMSKFNSIFFQNVPLGCFHSVELHSIMGTCQQSRLSSRPPCCCGLCACFGLGRCATTWRASDPLEVPVHRQILVINASLPPLGRQSQLVIHLNPEMSLTLARDFITQLHRYAPLLH